jgi:hypothetical protein
MLQVVFHGDKDFRKGQKTLIHGSKTKKTEKKKRAARIELTTFSYPLQAISLSVVVFHGDKDFRRGRRS